MRNLTVLLAIRKKLLHESPYFGKLNKRMMQKTLSTLSALLLFTNVWSQDWAIKAKATVPMAISNNAVTEGWVNGVPHVYTFGGIDSSKSASGITLNSFRYNTATDVWDTLADIPDTLGKIAMGASTVKNKIYIIGGYHVRANSSEVSSNKVHVFDPQSNSFLADASPLPVATDDHVQAVYNDSLIFVIGGWSNTGNIANVQIYDPKNDNWQVGSALPNTNSYLHFGASGTIVGNTIYYFGGARMGINFPITNTVRIGDINPNNPTQIAWRDTVLSPAIVGYRMAVTEAYGRVHWLGGSAKTYNYNGKAYSNGSGVEPLNRNLVMFTRNTLGFWPDSSFTIRYPMDLRGIAKTQANIRYIVGGMESGQKVSNKLLQLRHVEIFSEPEWAKDVGAHIYPNPAKGTFKISGKEHWSNVKLIDVNGTILKEWTNPELEKQFSISDFPEGLYLLRLTNSHESAMLKLRIGR